MTIAVSVVGAAHRSGSEVKEKWTNLQRTVKNELSKFRNKGKLVVARRQKCRLRALIKV